MQRPAKGERAEDLASALGLDRTHALTLAEALALGELGRHTTQNDHIKPRRTPYKGVGQPEELRLIPNPVIALLLAVP